MIYSEYSYYISNTFLRNKSEIDFDLINFNIQYCNSEAEQKKFIPGIIQKIMLLLMIKLSIRKRTILLYY